MGGSGDGTVVGRADTVWPCGREISCPCVPCTHWLACLRGQIDAQLESSSILWAQIEVVFDTILRKEDYVAQLVDFTKNPRLMKRFQVRSVHFPRRRRRACRSHSPFGRVAPAQARLRDYEYFWNSMRRMVVANLATG